MLSTNNNYDEREKKVLELYDQGKSTRDIAKELRMSLRDISIILRNSQLNHGIAITKDNENDNNNIKPLNQKATQAYKLFSKGTKLSDVAIELGLREKEASKLFGVLDDSSPLIVKNTLKELLCRCFMLNSSVFT